ncbi:hypothetical protein E2C01_090955 [Portunus trituberculatus]|uniref:Uncharacterized protein n=1 Tax=Portunus trituberculatus TaxID=210409 RepID=A0A5B7JG48_PORTR|nr:hypothetical protein [Portunus trituberculatus]
MLEEFLILVPFCTEVGHIASGMSLNSLKYAVRTAWEMLQHHIPLRNSADFFGKIPGGMNEVPTPISVVRHKPTRRRDLADLRN